MLAQELRASWDGLEPKSSKSARPIDPGTRMGASRDIPIAIGSDSDDGVGIKEYMDGFRKASLCTYRSFAGGSLPNSDHRSQLPPDVTPIPSIPSIYSPVGNPSSPSYALRQSLHIPNWKNISQLSTKRQPTKEEALPLEVPCAFDVDQMNNPERRSIHTRRISCSKSSYKNNIDLRAKESNERCRYCTNNRLPTTSNAFIPPESLDDPSLPIQHTPLGQAPYASGADITLADISNFDLRSKVAQLMAVAPAFSIRDLCLHLMDSKGRFDIAKDRAIRANEVTQVPPPIRSPCFVAHPSSFPRSDQPKHGVDCDDIMVKMDPNDPLFEWDDDEPSGEPTPTLRTAPKLKPKAKVQHLSNALPRRRKSRSQPSLSPAIHHNAEVGYLKSRLAKPIKPVNTGEQSRATSPNSDFLVTDDDTFMLSDFTYEDHGSPRSQVSSSSSDIEMTSQLED